MLLTERLKNPATAAFRDNTKLVRMTLEDREAAAQEYEQQAEQTLNLKAGLARLYNLERAKFLRGQVDHIAKFAPIFAEEIGYSDTNDE